MGISGEIEGKPGGGPLAELIRKVEDSQPDAVRQIGQRWRDSGGKSGDAGNEIKQTVTGLDGAWQGESADQFVDYMGKLTGGFDKAGQSVEETAGALDEAAGVVDAAKNALNSIGERALADAKKAEENFKESTALRQNDKSAMIVAEAARDNAIEQAMQQHTQEAETKIAEANEGLNGALSKIKGGADALRDVFSKLPKANEEGFTPGSGHKTNWEFETPPGAPAPTGSQSATPESGSSGPGGSGSGGSESGGGAASGSGGGAGSGGGSGSGGSEGGSGSGSGGLGSSGGPPSSGPPPGNVDSWIREAIKILKENGIPVTEADIDKIWTIIEKESGGNPHAINDWDSNAVKGTPSKGLMQCIDPTFESNKLPGHDDIYNPVDNIIAGVRYTFDRYGGFDGHPGLQAMAGGGGYQGY